MTWPRPRIAEYRARLDWNQDELAQELSKLAWHAKNVRVDVDRSAISKWELGKKRPGPFYRELLCLLFQADPIELGLRRPAPRAAVASLAGQPDGVDDDVNRRQLLSGAAMGALSLSVGQSWDRLAAALWPAALDPRCSTTCARTPASCSGSRNEFRPGSCSRTPTATCGR